MRRRAVIMGGKRPAGLALDPDMAEIAALRHVAAERAAFGLGLRGARLDRDLAATLGREAVRPDPAAGEVVGGEFPDRQPAGKTSGERIRAIMVLVAALEGRDTSAQLGTSASTVARADSAMAARRCGTAASSMIAAAQASPLLGSHRRLR